MFRVDWFASLRMSLLMALPVSVAVLLVALAVLLCGVVPAGAA